MFRFVFGLFICLVAIGALLGTGDDEDSDPAVATRSQAINSSPSKDPESTPEATTPVRAKHCVKVSRARAHSLVVFGAEDGYENKLRGTAWAVRSDDFKKIFFIAVPVRTEGVETTTVFASTYLESGGGLIWAVDSMADTITAWPNGEETDAKISMYDHGASEADDCLL